MPGAKDSPAAIMLRTCSSELFDVFDSQATKTKTKTEYWPIQTMLMILCPDIMLNIYTTSKDANKDPKGETKALFRAPDGSVDVKIMTDCLLAFFRLNPRKVLLINVQVCVCRCVCVCAQFVFVGALTLRR